MPPKTPPESAPHLRESSADERTERSRAGRRVTLADVGRHCGFHGSTVGLALRNHPGIPERTREKIQRAAKELGYHPDPALRALVAHRHAVVGTKGFASIAVIVDHPETSDWRKPDSVGKDYHEGMRRRAEALGYRLEEFNIGFDRSRERSVDRVLKARGVSTVVVAPLANTGLPVSLDWGAYSAVAIGYSLVSPPLARITHQHRDGSERAVRELMKLGYRRIAFLNPFAYEVRVGYGYSAGFFCMVNLHADLVTASSLVPKEHSNLATPQTLEWLREHRPEVVISSQAHLLPYLRESGLRIPGDLGFVRLGVTPVADPEEQVSGIFENSLVIGEETINLVAHMQASHFRGVPPIRQVHLVRGEWIQGSTLRRVGPSLL